MFRIALMIALIALYAAASAMPAQTPVAPATPYYAMDPNMPLSPYAASPVQQQVLENYRSQLLQVQREQLQHNPSGLGRAQIELGGRLNAYNPALPPPAANPPPPAAFNIVPSAVPTPPFNAAPPPAPFTVPH